MNDLTPHLGLPLPHPANDLESDVQRLRDALSMLDAAVASKAAAAEVDAALAQLLDSAPAALNSLRELAEALGNDPDFAATIASQVASIQSSIQALQSAVATKAEAADLAATNAAVAGKLDKAGGTMSGPIVFSADQAFPASQVAGLPGYATTLKFQ